MTGRPREETEVHTRILRLALGVSESRDYWQNVDPSLPSADRATIAFERRWFGAKSHARVRTLLGYLAARYDRFPDALSVLRRWRHMEPETRQVLCHWHLQLSDPLYRRFTGHFLVERRRIGLSSLDRDRVLQWVAETEPGRWSNATQIQFASKLLSAAWEAGLVSAPATRERTLTLPRVTDEALTYYLRVFRHIDFEGSLFANPYLDSVGLDEGLFEHRIRKLPGVEFHRMGELRELSFVEADDGTWAEALG